jgi:hypothetical protein
MAPPDRQQQTAPCGIQQRHSVAAGPTFRRPEMAGKYPHGSEPEGQHGLRYPAKTVGKTREPVNPTRRPDGTERERSASPDFATPTVRLLNPAENQASVSIPGIVGRNNQSVENSRCNGVNPLRRRGRHVAWQLRSSDRVAGEVEQQRPFIVRHTVAVKLDD